MCHESQYLLADDCLQQPILLCYVPVTHLNCILSKKKPLTHHQIMSIFWWYKFLGVIQMKASNSLVMAAFHRGLEIASLKEKGLDS